MVEHLEILLFNLSRAYTLILYLLVVCRCRR